MSWDCQSAEYTMKLNNSDLPQEKRRSQEINLLNFVTLCCGILTIETSHSFLRSFCFIGQNGAFSTTEQNQ